MRPSRTLAATAMVATLAVGGVGAALAAGDPTPTPPPRIAFVARSDVPVDALAVGPVAGQLGAPLFVTPPGALIGSARDALVAYGPELVVIAGGPAAVSAATEAQIEAALGLPADKVVRAEGTDRHETAVAISNLLATFAPAFLPIPAVATDADLLDGMDATEFVAAADVAGLVPVAVVNVDASGAAEVVAWRAPLTAEPVVTRAAPGIYDVDLPGVNYRYDRDAAVCSLNDGDAGSISLNSINGDDLRVFTDDLAGTATDRDFACAVYDVT